MDLCFLNQNINQNQKFNETRTLLDNIYHLILYYNNFTLTKK